MASDSGGNNGVNSTGIIFKKIADPLLTYGKPILALIVTIIFLLYFFDSKIKANVKNIEKNVQKIQMLEKSVDKVDTKLDQIINILMKRK